MITDFNLLLKETADAFGVTAEAILAPGRKAHIALARQVVMALWSDHHPFQDCVDRVNRGCHNTAMHARDRILNKAEFDKGFAAVVAGIAARCQYQPQENEVQPIELTA